MKLLDQVNQFAVDESTKKQVVSLLETAIEQHQTVVQSKEAEIQAMELKIEALTLELAHLRRLRYGVKNEALSALQQDLFQECWNEDLAAVKEEVEQLTSSVKKNKRE